MGGLFKAKSVPARGWAGLTHLQPTWACPVLLGAGSDGWGVGKDSWWAGRHECHVLGDRKPVMVATATMSCVYCVDIWRREDLCPACGDAGLGSSRHLLITRRVLSGRPVRRGWQDVCPAVRKADRLYDPQLPVRPAPGIACRRARPRGLPWPLPLPPLPPLTLWKVNILPENQSQKPPRCAQKRFSSNIDNRSLWKFMSMVAAIWRRKEGVRRIT